MAISYPTNTLKDVLGLLIKEHNLSESELARNINLPRATINRITTGKIVDPKSSTLTLIANYFGVTIDQLLGYKQIENISTAQPSNKVAVPLYDLNQILNFYKEAKSIEPNSIEKRETITFKYDRNDSTSLIALKVTGDAMWPYFDDESIVVINLTIQPQNRSFVLAHIYNNDEIVLRQLLIDGKSKVLVPINVAFKPITMELKDSIIGSVVHVEKNFYYN